MFFLPCQVVRVVSQIVCKWLPWAVVVVAWGDLGPRIGLDKIPVVLAAEVTAPLPLTPEAVRSRLETLPNWHTNAAGTALIHQRTFVDFGATVNFVRCLVPVADAAQHHPDIAIRYNQLTLTLTTHDVGGLTDLDFQLADTINRLHCPSIPLSGQGNESS